jgi:CheY-like chemotaxis protein
MNLEQNCLFFNNGENAYIKSIDIIDEERKCHDLLIKDNPLAKIEIRPISLMLLDLQMPRMTGLEVIKKLRDWISKQNVLGQVKI